ncbi:hypothetical protein HU200_022774 [Digitaria exilis]|uniref:TF-B3 domain-containing protein n=1 Tax=Digitaria exilis TaxID=1010633 RepID=A0A835C482_9POAL|nr:hypothetical protein HU200_022774 [Digitaria exilis]
MRKSNVQNRGPYLVISKEYALAHFPHETTYLTLQRPGKSKKWRPRFYIRNDGRVYMLRGQWSDFVRDNHLQEGDICLLLPTKTGRKFTVTVHILRATKSHSRGERGTGSQRVGPCHGGSSTEMTSAVPVKDEPADGEHVPSESKEVSDGSLNSNDSGGPSEESTDGENMFPRSSMNETTDESLNSKDSGGPSEPPYIVPAQSSLSRSQKKIVKAKVQAIQCEVPIYVVIMRRTSITVYKKLLEFGARYATYLPAKEQRMVLHCNGNKWNTELVLRNGRRLFLNGGWPRFVHDNGLRLGDICLFELNKNESKLTMEVHIIPREQF